MSPKYKKGDKIAGEHCKPGTVCFYWLISSVDENFYTITEPFAKKTRTFRHSYIENGTRLVTKAEEILSCIDHSKVGL